MQIKLCKNRFSLVLVVVNLTVEQRRKTTMAIGRQRASKHSGVRHVLPFFTVDAKALASGRAKQAGMGWIGTVRKEQHTRFGVGWR
ncbi:hypothetical protein GUJ93_ZPchr0013g37373 [Zizania palustris]|uniref:Uncharacterized protein n=1 Tax=Zizania palustris TaxID=103762 RepID=A0A8J5X5K5_ZIZPA|nr:hypothetical protein GUJ93_ZPchr0013g37373 [Zizania palustris]